VPPAPRPPEARQPSTIQLTPCRVPRSSESVLCGTHAVLEDRSPVWGRRVALKIGVLPALGPTARRRSHLRPRRRTRAGRRQLASGATARWFTERFRRGARHRLRRSAGDGRLPTGCCAASATAMRCRTASTICSPSTGVRACRETLALLADLRLYTTPIAMDDLDDVRAALGYPRRSTCTEVPTARRRRSSTCASIRRAYGRVALAGVGDARGEANRSTSPEPRSRPCVH